jgi:hypothetical protein
MIKFFRKIRQRLLTENKFSKYLLYAIGEIILVVIGILIALQINNWNQTKILKIEEIKSLKALKSEFQVNLLEFDNTHAHQLNRNDAINQILFSDISNYSLSSLDSLYLNANFNWTYNPSFGIYNSLINSGKIQLISNDTLKNKISRFKELVNDYLEDEIFIMNFASQFSMEHFVNDETMLVESKFGLRLRNEIETLHDKDNYLNEFKSPKYRNRLSIVLLNGKPVISVGIALRKEMVTLIEMMESEIDKLKKG